MGFFDFFNSKKGDKRADDSGAAGSGAIFPADSSDDADGGADASPSVDAGAASSGDGGGGGGGDGGGV